MSGGIEIREMPKTYLQPNGDLGKCYNILKYLMFSFNLLFWILGCVVLGVGVGIHVDAEFKAAISNYIPAANVGANLFIFVGVVMMVTGFLGCCGAIRESQCLLFVFFLILFLVFLLLIGASIWAAASKSQLQTLLETTLQKKLRSYYTVQKSKEDLDGVQKTLKCCGVKGGAVDYQREKLRVPPSCGNDSEHTSRQGCYYSIVAVLTDNLTKITAAGMGIGIIILLGLVLSMMLCCYLRESF